jgi:histidine triad (HIT) family protein
VVTAPGCVFCAVVDGTSPAHVVLDDDVAVAFLDVRPLFPGHVLVVPRDHHETVVDLPGELVGPFFERVRRLAAAVPAATGAVGTFVAMNNVVSQSVPHLHAHVVPRRPRDGLRGFFWPRTRYDDDAHAAGVAAALRAELDRPG